MELLIETENQPINLLLDDTDTTISFKNKKDYYFNYNIKLYNISDSTKELVATVNGIYFDILYIIKNDLDLFKSLNVRIKDKVLLENFLDYYGEIRGEYLSSYYNLYFIDKIKIETKYKHQNFDIFILKNIINILMFKDKMLIGNIIIKPILDYKIKDNSVIEHYKYEEKYNSLISSYVECGFEKIDNTDYMILVNE